MAVVYKICHKSALYDEEYVGSTTRLRTRIGQHKTSCLNSNDEKYNRRLYKFIREHGGWDDWDFHVLEEVRFDETEGAPSKKFQLCHRERYWIETLKPMLNCCQAQLVVSQYCECGHQTGHCKKCSPPELYAKYLEMAKEYNKQMRADPERNAIINARRKTPEAKAKAAANARARRARKKAEKQQV